MNNAYRMFTCKLSFLLFLFDVVYQALSHFAACKIDGPGNEATHVMLCVQDSSHVQSLKIRSSFFTVDNSSEKF